MSAFELNTPAWMGQSLCSQIGGDEWYQEKGGSSRTAIAVCRRCPVREQCLAYALEHRDRDGIWGGLTPMQRRPLLREDAA